MRTTASAPVQYNTDRMKRDMALRGWINTDLARAARLSDMTVTRWFTGVCRTARTAKKLADALGYPVKRYILEAREDVA